MSEKTNQNILKEAHSFIEAMLSTARQEIEDGRSVEAILFMPVKRKAYPASLARGMSGRIRHHGENGELHAEIPVGVDEDLDEALERHDLQGDVEGTPVFSVPLLEDRDAFSLGIATAYDILGDVKFIAQISEAWSSANKDIRPSQDPDREEIVVGWVMVFTEEGKFLSFRQIINHFNRDGKKITWDEANMQDLDLEEAREQPLPGKILDRLGF